jgi:hypothetical protein
VRWPMIVSFARKPDFSALKEESDTVNDVSHYFIDTLICNRISIPMKLAGKVALPKSYISGPQVLVFWWTCTLSSPGKKLVTHLDRLKYRKNSSRCHKTSQN